MLINSFIFLIYACDTLQYNLKSLVNSRITIEEDKRRTQHRKKDKLLDDRATIGIQVGIR